MERIYNDAKDKYVAATKIFVKNADAHAYADAACTVQIDQVTLKNIFEQRAIIIDNSVEYQPTSFNVNAGVGIMTYVKADGSVATTAVLATVSSKELV